MGRMSLLGLSPDTASIRIFSRKDPGLECLPISSFNFYTIFIIMIFLKLIKPAQQCRKVLTGLLILNLCTIPQTLAAESRHFPPGTRQIYISNSPEIRQKTLAKIAPLVEKSIADGYYPGAVILVGHRGRLFTEGYSEINALPLTLRPWNLTPFLIWPH